MAPFILVGVAAAIVYAVTATAILRFGAPGWVASMIAYAVIIPLAYLAQRRWTFSSAARHAHAFPRYASIQILGLVASGPISAVALQIVPSLPLLSFILVGAAIAVVSFVLQRAWAFAQ